MAGAQLTYEDADALWHPIDDGTEQWIDVFVRATPTLDDVFR
jgi:hypothetical protein